jgi:copper chaperone CopZ/Pyruvate/2-oxoacid:ferredoxin oxidoreductase delta subunit
MKETGKLFTEKLAREKGREHVTVEDIETTKKIYYDRVPEEIRNQELDKRIAEGETDLRECMEKSARQILKNPVDLFDVNICHAKYFRCISQNIEVRKLKEEIKQKLRQLKVTEMIADMLPDNERILAHHKFVVSVSGCINGCTGPETSPFGVSGAAKPIITAAECLECFTCVDRCRKNAISIRHGRPEIDAASCDHCGNCIKFCPNTVFASEQTGYRIFIGGKFGRFHHDGYELFKITDKETLMKSLEATIELIKGESMGEENLTSILNRVGVAPVFEKLYGSGTDNIKKLKIPVKGITCPKCADRVKSALKSLHGVQGVHVDVTTGIAEVVFDCTSTSTREMGLAIKAAGYSVVCQ